MSSASSKRITFALTLFVSGSIVVIKREAKHKKREEKKIASSGFGPKQEAVKGVVLKTKRIVRAPINLAQ